MRNNTTEANDGWISIAVLYDGWTDKSVAEREVVYVAFADPETGKPTSSFLESVAISESQDAPGLKKAIISTFKRNSLEKEIVNWEDCFSFIRQCFGE